ncbi:hypothetical protein [Streptomyces klenkii]|uniref:hypothetical protein n=1 Tax=Streptomyces klenkii TaxID=1420899 RepID=UPI003440811C
MNRSWQSTVDALADRAEQAARSSARVSEAKDELVRIRPAHLAELSESDPAAYRRQVEIHVRSGGFAQAQRALLGAVALSKAHDAALLKAAGLVLRRRADGRPAPRRLPSPRVLPGEATPKWWIDSVNNSAAGIWRVIPEPGPESMLGARDDLLVQDVAQQARRLQASLTGHRARGSYYEAYEPDPAAADGHGIRPVPALPGLGERVSRQVNLMRSQSMRVPASRLDEFRQAGHDAFAVWERARGYGDAVVALLRSVG